MTIHYLLFDDDGHGMTTAGKRTPYIPELKRFIHENEFNRAVVKYTVEAFKRMPAVKVFLTAPTDADTSLKARTDYANKVYADHCKKYGKENVKAVFISEHYNAFDSVFNDRDPEGFSVHIYKGHASKEAGRLAKIILKHGLKGTVQKNRGVVEQDLHIVRETHMVACLVENGFMDNKREALLMINQEFQKECAEERAQALCEYWGIKYVAPKTESEISSVPKPSTPAPPKPASGPKYKVIVGSFGSKANADSRLKGVQAKIPARNGLSGIEVKSVNGKPFYRVTYGPVDKANAVAIAGALAKANFDCFLETL